MRSLTTPRCPIAWRRWLASLYLVFNEGYAATAADELVRRDLCAEAIRLARVLGGLMPDESEALALLALMLLQDSRRDTRVDDDGALVLLEDQDRSRWDHAQIAEGRELVLRALALGPAGPYALQAAIAAEHAARMWPEDTDWHRIAVLYDLLVLASPSPVVELNHAVAVAMARGPERRAGHAGLRGVGSAARDTPRGLSAQLTRPTRYPAGQARGAASVPESMLDNGGYVDLTRE